MRQEPDPTRRFALLAFAWMAALGGPEAACASVPAEDPAEWQAAGLPEDSFEEYGRLRGLLAGKSLTEAEAGARAMLSHKEREYGAESLQTSLALDCLVEALHFQGRDSEEETLAQAERNVRIKRAQLGPDHRQTSWAITLLAWTHRARGDLERSLELQRETLAIAERIPPEDELVVPYILDGIASTLRMMGRLDEAKERQLRAVSLLEATESTDDLARATAWNNLAIIHEMLAEYDDARALHARALAAREAALPAAHPDLAQSHQNLAVVEALTGHPRLALDHFQRALDISRDAFGDAHPEVAASWNNLAIIHSELGDYLRAREDLEEALAIRRRVFGEDHWQTAQSKYNLASVLHEMGDLEEAGTLYREALLVQREKLGRDHPRVALTVQALATVLAEEGHARAAIPMFEQAAVIREKALGRDHPDWASARHGLGEAERRLGRLDDAERHFREALAVQEAALPPAHPAIATSLVDLADVVRLRGQPDEALGFADRALAIRREILGEGHPGTAQAMRRRADALADLGRSDEAFRAALAAEAIARANARTLVRGVSERRALRWLDRAERGLPLVVKLAAAAPENAERTHAAWDAVVQSRALVLAEMAERSRAAAQPRGPEARALADELSGARRRHATLVLRGPEDGSVAAWVALVESTRREKESAERALAERTPRPASRPGVGLEQTLAALPAGAALLAYARWDGAGDEAGGYGAFVARREGSVRVVPLGVLEEIDEAIAAWHATLGAGGGRGMRRVSNPAPRDEEEARQTGERVRRLVWDPVAPLLGDAGLVFVVPDGALHFVTPDALPTERGWLAEEAPLFHFLSAERALVATAEATVGEGLLAVGGPDFAGSAAGAAAGIRGSEVTCDAVRALRFLPLPGAEREAADVVAAWERAAGGGALRLDGAAATEARVKEHAPGRRAIHLATHGFLIEQGCGSPLLHSGLALAGANVRAPAVDFTEDGILTAEEIASLPLEGVEWVVLSACETGLGGVRVGEGILGLRRAFETAGARTLVTSLWSVGDTTTRRWMAVLYEAHFGDGLSPPAAVRRANLQLLRERRATGAPAPPSAWTGFVASGDWR